MEAPVAAGSRNDLRDYDRVGAVYYLCCRLLILYRKERSGPYPHEVLELPILGTVLLLSSSGTIVVAEHMLQKDRQAGFNLWWFITFALGFGFLIYTAVE